MAMKKVYQVPGNQHWPTTLRPVARESLPAVPAHHHVPTEVWRSRDFLVMVYLDQGYERLSVVRTRITHLGRFDDDISWDDLQRLKAECGRGDRWATEIYPPSAEVVNVQNMRHLFVLPEPPPYGWKAGGR